MGSLTSFTEESFLAAVARSIDREVERVVAEEAETAAERVCERVRGEVAKIALAVLESYSVMLTGRDVLEIRVDLKGGRP